jgi:hypothetical protein
MYPNPEQQQQKNQTLEEWQTLGLERRSNI